MATPIEELKREHRAIERVLAGLGQVSSRLVGGEAVEPALLERYIDFIRTFADRCHHHKEELVLFPAMIERGFPAEGGPIHCMLNEHVEGRAFVARMAAAVEQLRLGNDSAREEFAAAAAGYRELLTQHIYKEDNILFRMAESVLGAEGVSSLADKFAAAEAEMGAGRHEDYERWAQTQAPSPQAAAAEGSCFSGCGEASGVRCH